MKKGDVMQKTVLFILIIFSCSIFSDPLFFLTNPTTHFSIELYNNQFKLSIFQPFFYTSVPVDWMLPDQNRDLIKGLISVESGFFIHALSEKGAMGLTQLMPSTAQQLGVLNPFNIFWSIDGANRYLNILKNKFGKIEYALSAYYEGPGKVELYGPSKSGFEYSRKVLSESNRLKDQPVFLKDVLYIQPYAQIGENYSAGSNFYFSIFGIVDLATGIDFSPDGISHFVLAYPTITQSFSLIIGEKNFNPTIGVCYRKIPDFGVQFLLSSQDFDLSVLLKIWQLYIDAGFSSKGLHIGVIK